MLLQESMNAIAPQDVGQLNRSWWNGVREQAACASLKALHAGHKTPCSKYERLDDALDFAFSNMVRLPGSMCYMAELSQVV